jgi:sulfite reductase beta subunit-like hemoprotein
LAEELGQDSPGFDNDAEQVLKHHGVYQQDNRDTRAERRQEGLGPDRRLMVRVKLPAGRITAEQYLLCDRLADQYGQGDLRVTSRQGLQFHGVRKHDLRPIVHDLNLLAQLTTLGAAGDVVRNVIAPPVADIDPRYRVCGPAVMALCQAIGRHFQPKTPGYHEIWVDDQRATVHEDGTVAFQPDRAPERFQEPVYGNAYLPRKFKIAIATEFDNSVDVYTNDVGLIAVTDGDRFSGFEVLVGGGMGHAYNQPDRPPRLANHFAFVSQEEAIPLLDAIVKVFRDHGNRGDRHHARLRHFIGEVGIVRFRELVETVAGRPFLPPCTMKPTGQYHYLGWSRQVQEGLNYVGIWLENGRIRDFSNGPQFRTALREAVARFSPEVRFTPHHNVVLAQIADADVEPLDALLRDHGIDVRKGMPPLRQWEMACPALPYCPRALSEAERAIPELMRAVELETGGGVDVMVRMSGCSNSCSRPRTSEIGLIAKNSREYLVYVGGNRMGTRLNELLVDDAPLDSLAPILVCLIGYWRAGRAQNEDFGDWVCRTGLSSLRARLSGDLNGNEE